MEPPLFVTRQNWLIASLLCCVSLTYETRRKPVRAALQAKGWYGHFLPCTETSKLMMEMIVPSQRFIMLHAEQWSPLDSVIGIGGS